MQQAADIKESKLLLGILSNIVSDVLCASGTGDHFCQYWGVGFRTDKIGTRDLHVSSLMSLRSPFLPCTPLTEHPLSFG